MKVERVLEVINLLRVPERYRRLWPQRSVVFVSIEGEIVDVLQYYADDDTAVDEVSALYPGVAYFYADVGMYKSTEEVKKKVEGCVKALKRKRPKGLRGALLKIDGKWVPSIGSITDSKRKNKAK
jgi:hypothetical protein